MRGNYRSVWFGWHEILLVMLVLIGLWLLRKDIGKVEIIDMGDRVRIGDIELGKEFR